MLGGDFLPAGYVGATPAFVVLVVVFGVGWGALIGWMLLSVPRLRARQAHESLTREEHAARALFPGPSRVVHGRVEVDGEAPAVEVDIEQEVKNHSGKNSKWHTWVERSRELTARAFRVVRDDGQAVLVEPGNDVLLVDTLETRYPIALPRRRVRAAVLRAGEEVWVYGDLFATPGGGAYRGQASFVLRAPRSGRILVANDAVKDRYTARLRFLLPAGLFLAALYLLLHFAFTLSFVRAEVVGQHDVATVTGTHQWTTYNKNGAIQHYGIRARAADGFALDREVSYDAYHAAWAAAERHEPATVPILRVSDSPDDSSIGSEPGVHIVSLLVVSMLAIVVTALILWKYDERVAWYDRRRVREYGGRGFWVETRTPDGTGLPIDPGQS